MYILMVFFSISLFFTLVLNCCEKKYCIYFFIIYIYIYLITKLLPFTIIYIYI